MKGHQTCFFRDPAQLDVLAGPILDELLARSPQVRLWSAGCSSGQEPYSLAMRLLETGKIADEQLAIRATDVTPEVLATAREAVYPESAFRPQDAAHKERWFHPRDGAFVLDERVRRLVSFDELDLRDAARVAAEGPFDAIFCRYVLMFIAEPAGVLESLARALRPGGYLFVDEDEFPHIVTDLFLPVEGLDATVYRRKAAVLA